MTFTDYVFEHSGKLDKTAIIHRKKGISYMELCRGIDIAAALCGQGGRESVMVVSENSPLFVKAFYGIIKSGCICVPVNPAAAAEELDYIIGTLEIGKIFADEKLVQKLKEKIGGNGRDITVYTEKDLEVAAAVNAPTGFPNRSADADDEDTAVIMFTSGSTAVPKGVLLSHRNLMCNTASIIEYLNLKADDRMEVVLPFYYCYGTSLLNTHLRCGGSLVINNRFMFPDTVLQDINTYGCTGFAGVPSTFQILMRMTNLKNTATPSLKYITQAGGKLQDTCINELTDTLKNVEIIVMYGQTEATARLSYLPSEFLKTKMGSIGKGIPGTKLEVLDKEGRPVKPGETGEIVATGCNVMKGYLNDEEATKKVLRDGSLYTGDLATVDEDGFIYILAREKNIIKCGGNRVSPKDIENVIVQIPEVVECAVVGVPHEILGEAVKAWVVLKPGANGIDSDYVIRFCTERLEKHKVPRFVEFLAGLPKNSSGKVLYKKLGNNDLLESVIFADQFQKPQAEKEKILTAIIREQLEANEKNENIKKLYSSWNFRASDFSRLEDVPFIPVSMFKDFDLITCEQEDVARVLNSSATTTGKPSRIYLDRDTSRRQSQALATTLKSYLGVKRRPMLIIDSSEVNSREDTLTARGAAVRGICTFGRDICYALKKGSRSSTDLELDLDRILEFQEKHRDEEILVYGFTYIIWSRFVQELRSRGITLSMPNMKLLHSGGWKKLGLQSVGKREFDEATAEVFGTEPESIIDFYGMVEQVGVVFIDCPCGNKHVPDFAEVIIRDVNTLEEVKPGGTGMIEVMSALGTSYPSQAILTEDMGQLVGVDNCGCGRKGKYFRFRSRVQKAEIRGCGDTFAERENGS
jgi:long-chain acyl-CoA synthetase